MPRNLDKIFKSFKKRSKSKGKIEPTPAKCSEKCLTKASQIINKKNITDTTETIER